MAIYATDKDGNRRLIAGLGPPGKSAYQYAVEGGFSGTEDEFRALMGTGPWVPEKGFVPASNLNLLDNWYLANPINQRGQTEYTAGASAIYCVDRWRLGRGSAALEADGLAFAWDGQNGTYGFLNQLIDRPELAGQTVTASALIGDELCSVTGQCPGKGGEAVASGDVFANNTVGLLVEWTASSDYPKLTVTSKTTAPNKLKAAKLELGPVQTLAHQAANGAWVSNGPPPDYGTELLKCQRYFWACGTQLVIAGNVNNAGSTLVATVSTPSRFRAKPAISCNMTMTGIRTFDGTNIPGSSISSIVVSEVGSNYVNLLVNAAGLSPRTTAELLLYHAILDANL